jgi:hypothetical protein
MRSPLAASIDKVTTPLAAWGSLTRRDRKKGRRHLNGWVVLCVIVGSGGHAVGLTMFGSEDATFR